MISTNTKFSLKKQHNISFFNAIVAGQTTDSMISTEAVEKVKDYADKVAETYFAVFQRFPIFPIVRFAVLRYILETDDQYDELSVRTNREYNNYFTEGAKKRQFETQIDELAETTKDTIDGIYAASLGRGVTFQELLILADAATDANQLSVVPVSIQETIRKKLR